MISEDLHSLSIISSVMLVNTEFCSQQILQIVEGNSKRSLLRISNVTVKRKLPAFYVIYFFRIQKCFAKKISVRFRMFDFQATWVTTNVLFLGGVSLLLQKRESRVMYNITRES